MVWLTLTKEWRVNNKLAGWSISIYSLLMLGLLILFKDFLSKLFFVQNAGFPQLIESVPIVIWVLALLHILGFVAGRMLIKNIELGHSIALPFSIISLFNIPVGTIIGALYLWLRSKEA